VAAREHHEAVVGEAYAVVLARGPLSRNGVCQRVSRRRRVVLDALDFLEAHGRIRATPAGLMAVVAPVELDDQAHDPAADARVAESAPDDEEQSAFAPADRLAVGPAPDQRIQGREIVAPADAVDGLDGDELRHGGFDEDALELGVAPAGRPASPASAYDPYGDWA
jgi:hypothetical protein